MSSAPTINFSGLASGIDTSSIITQLTTVAQKPVTKLQAQDDAYNAQLSAWQTLNANLASLQSSVTTLGSAATYQSASGTSSNSAVASVTTQPGAALGTHSLTVTQLATAQKVVSSSIASSSTALGATGSFILNGKTIGIVSSDALSDVATKINAASAGVTATVVNVSTNNYVLTLTSNSTGKVNAISASDVSGGVLNSLGVLSSSAAAIRQSVSYTQNTNTYTGAASLTLSSGTSAFGTLLGIASGSAPSGAFTISNGGSGASDSATINVNLNTASLTDVANAINQAGITGVSAQVVTLPDVNGNVGRIHQLQIVNKTASAPGTSPTFTDTNGVLKALGVVQAPFTRTVTSAQDSNFNLDGLDFTRSSNTIGDIVPGASIQLLSGTTLSPGVTNINIAQNTDTVVQAVNSFVSSYNTIQNFISTQNTFTPPTNTTAGVPGTSDPLFGNTTLSQIQDQLSNALTAVSGKTTLGSIGVTTGTDGTLSVDTTTLTSALQSDPTSVANLFSSSGLSDSSSVQFISAGLKTVPTSGTGYTVNITQPATQSVGTAGTINTHGSLSGAPESLTFSGALFPTSVKLTIPAGSTIQDTAALINNTSSLNSSIYATVDSGNHLVISSQNYGSNVAFSVVSDTAASATNSGIGPSLSVTYGLDVAGTINGESATGIGRSLTGDLGNATTAGLQLLVSATAPSGLTPAHVTVNGGIASSLTSTLTQILDPINGTIAGAENSINTQISDTQAQIATIQQTVTDYTAYLTQLFSDMETQVSALQAQGNAFNASIGAVTNSTSNSTTSSSAGTGSVSSG